jgi:hypothetical protein
VLWIAGRGYVGRFGDGAVTSYRLPYGGCEHTNSVGVDAQAITWYVAEGGAKCRGIYVGAISSTGEIAQARLPFDCGAFSLLRMKCASMVVGSRRTLWIAGGSGLHKLAVTPPRAGPGIALRPQTAGINRQRIVAIAVRCTKAPCSGALTLTVGKGRGNPATLRLGRSTFSLQSTKTAKIKVRVSERALKLIRQRGRRLSVTATVVLDPGGVANAVTQRLTLKA